jgi:tight adherence protein C
MSVSILLVILGVLFFIAIIGLGYAMFGAPNLAKRISIGYSEPGPVKSTPSKWRSFLKRSETVVKPLGELIPRSSEEMSRQEQRLVKAGFRRKDAAMLLYGAKVSIAIALLLTFLLTRVLWSNPVLYVALSVLFGAMIPDLWLKYKVAQRTDRIQLALPNALDLGVVCVEAGLGLDQALMRIGQEMRRGFPELSEELNLLALETNAGRRRADALRNLGNRTDSQDLKSFVAVLIQTERFGTSITQSLRVFAETMRTTRRLRAEEHAAKMSVKIIPALVAFIFPAMVIVVLGPTMIALIRELLPSLGGR